MQEKKVTNTSKALQKVTKKAFKSYFCAFQLHCFLCQQEANNMEAKFNS